jgi:DNA adenine methylase
LRFLIPYIPRKFGKYYEPFLGGGSMFFYLGPKCAEISDVSLPLIETFKAAKRNPDDILRLLQPLKPNKKTFERFKKYAPRNRSNRAAKFIFLNKACWNGLFRVNSDGIFNVPFGQPKTDFVINEKNFVKCATQLRRREVSIRHQDFQEIVDRVKPGDFAFLDPPYVTSHNMNGFVDWNESLFSWGDQVRLAEMAEKMVKAGANVLVTNADHPDIRELYKSFGSRRFIRYSTLASDTSRRTKTSEAIFFGGPAYLEIAAAPDRREAKDNEILST